MTTKRRLLDAVDEVIAEHGSDGVTLRRVGAAAGLSHTAAAHYFRDKPGLMTAYVTRAYERVADGLDEAASDGDANAALVAAGLAYGRFAQEQPAAFSVMSRLELTRATADELWDARNRAFATLKVLVERYQSEGWARDRDTLDLLATCWSFVHGFVALWTGGPLAVPYENSGMLETLESLLGALLRSLDG